MFPGEIDPQELKSRLAMMMRSESAYNDGAMVAASVFLGSPGTPMPFHGGDSVSPGVKRRKKKINWQYPSISSLINEEDPEKDRESDRQHLWSQSKINLLKRTLKNYRKIPVDTGI